MLTENGLVRTHKAILCLLVLFGLISFGLPAARAQGGYDPGTQTPALLYDEARAVYLGNLARRDNGLPPLRWNRQLTLAARWFSWDSTENRPTGFCGHQDTLGRSFGDRTTYFGYPGFAGAENAYCGYVTPETAIQGWMNSPGHRANLLDPDSREIGLGYYRRSSDGRGYVTQDFGIDHVYAPVVIENEALSTTSPNVNLYIYDRSASGGFAGLSAATQMMLSNNPYFAGAVWEPYSAGKAWTLSGGTGWRDVYVKTRDALDRTLTASDSIFLGAPSSLPLNEIGTGQQMSTTQSQATLYGLNGGGLPQVQLSLGWLADDTSATFSRLWGNGERVSDPAARGGTAFRLYPGSGEASAWVWETDFVKDTPMVAYVRLKVNDNTSSAEVARFSIKGGGTVYGPLSLKGTDFTAPDQYQEFPLSFTFRSNPADAFLIFQFWQSGSADVYVDAVSIFSAPQPITSPLTWSVPGGAYRGQGVWVRYTNGSQFSEISEGQTSPPPTLTVNRIGSGTVTSSPAGISCGLDCSETYAYNTVVTLTATPAGGYLFAGWDGACSGTGTCTVSMTAAQAVTARFVIPAAPGTYDDSQAAWYYSGAWQTYSGAGPYNNTLHQSSIQGSYAEVLFNGAQIKLSYLMAPGRGSIDVLIDGSKVDTLNADSSGIIWQVSWTSPALSPGIHRVRLVNAGGGRIDLDAMQVFASATSPGPLGEGIYDDVHEGWTYSGAWYTFSGSGPYGNTLHQNNVAGSSAGVRIDGAQVRLTYLKAPGRGSIDIYIDGTKVASLNASSATIVWQAAWTSPALTPGVHTVRLVHAGGGWIDLDAIQVFPTAAPPSTVGAGTYDDAHEAWTYSGTWATFNGSGPFSGTLHQSNVQGSYAEVPVNGAQVRLTYLKAPGRGSIDVLIDGTRATILNANSSGIVWQATWTSSTLTAGNHTIRLVHAGGGWIDLDAIQVFAAPVSVGAGQYDDAHTAWTYSGTWSTFSGSGPYANTLHQSNVRDSFGEVVFNGAQVKLTYLKAPGRGSIDVLIDGTKVTTLSANSSGIVWQAAWTSPPLPTGVHTVRLANAAGGWIDLDALEVFALATVPGTGTFDDAHAAWTYFGAWSTFSGSGPYGGTLHQSSRAGDYAEFYFAATQIRLTYLKAPGRGSMDVLIDGTHVATLNAGSSSIEWQTGWTSPALTTGVHTVRLVNAGGGWIDLDAIQLNP